MHFSEDDLRSALGKKDPGVGFTERVMSRIVQAEAKASPWSRLRALFVQPLWPLNLRTALAGTLLAAVVLGALGYRQFQEKRAGELAKQETVLALRITTAKLNHVFERVKASQAREVRIRREHL
jgi:hypothetical protein